MKMKVFFTYDRRIDGMGDEYINFYFSKNECLMEAKSDWSYFTASEKQRYEIMACEAEIDMDEYSIRVRPQDSEELKERILTDMVLSAGFNDFWHSRA